MANFDNARYYGGMDGIHTLILDSVRKARDGDGQVAFDRLPMPGPEPVQAFGAGFLIVQPDALARLSERAFRDMQFLMRPTLATRLRSIARGESDSAGSTRSAGSYDETDGPGKPAHVPGDTGAYGSGLFDRYVAATLLENAMVAARGVYPLCQDTGTATVFAWKGDRVITGLSGTRRHGGDGPGQVSGEASVNDHEPGKEWTDESVLKTAAAKVWKENYLRNSQLAPLPGFMEKNTGDNSPVAIHIESVPGDEYHFLFIAKGGGSANKTQLFQETKRLLRPDAFRAFVRDAITKLGVSACPPYRIALVLGGQSAEETTLVAKLASAGALDAMPCLPGDGGGAHRDLELETVVMEEATASGWGAQLGGVALARDARVIRLPRHAASLPVAIAVSCSAHRQVYARITRDGYFVEHLLGLEELAAMTGLAGRTDTNPAPGGTTRAGYAGHAGATAMPATQGSVKTRRMDLDAPDDKTLRETIRSLKAGELVELWGPVVLARDAAHARLLSILEKGGSLPDWVRFPVFYAGPTETPPGRIIGAVGPTTSRRMDSYLDSFGAAGIFPLSIGKGERGVACAQACGRYGTAYLAAIGGAAALAAERYVSSNTLLDWPELGMEAIRLVWLAGLPALVAVDATGADYYADITRQRR